MPDGLATTGGVGAETSPERILEIFAQDIERFPLTEIDVFQFVRSYDRSGQSGNVQEIVYANFSNGYAQDLAEGEDPEISHADLSRILLTAGKVGERVGVTEEMIEDGRFDEMQMALEHAGNKMVNSYVSKFFTELKAGPYGASDVPEDYNEKTWANAAAHLYSADHDTNGYVAQSQAGHVYNTGDTVLYPGDISLAIRHIEEHGHEPDVIMCSEAGLQMLRDSAGWTKDITATTLPQEMMRLGRPGGQLMGLDIIVIRGGRLGDAEFIVTSRKEKPIGYLNKRSLRMDTHDRENGHLGWDVRGATLSARYGFGTLWKGATVVFTVAA